MARSDEALVYKSRQALWQWQGEQHHHRRGPRNPELFKRVADAIQRDAAGELSGDELVALADEVDGIRPEQQPAADKADTKTDKPKKLPRNPELLKAAKFVCQYREKVCRDGAPELPLIGILSEFTHGNHSKAKSLGRSLQPSRYGWLLKLNADK